MEKDSLRVEQLVHTTPKNFVLTFAAMIALYASAGSFVALLFSYINYKFPDELYSYYDPYSDIMRFALASLVIFFPAYLVLTRIINVDVRKNVEKSGLAIRKWLIYLTLLTTGFILLGDLVALVHTFLGGEISTRFILKVLAILAVVGAIFTYYLFDIRGYWQSHESHSKLYGLVVSVLVVAAIVAGFIVVGSPAKQRALRFDQERIDDLSTIQYQVTDYWQAKQKLPDSLAQLADPTRYVEIPTDPQTKSAYEYRKIDNTNFELCAKFNQSSQNGIENSSAAYPDLMGEGNNSWQHEAGRACFTRTIDPEFYPPFSDKNMPVDSSSAAGVNF